MARSVSTIAMTAIKGFALDFPDRVLVKLDPAGKVQGER